MSASRGQYTSWRCLEQDRCNFLATLDCSHNKSCSCELQLKKFRLRWHISKILTQ
jgi:hypothetical protein